MKTLLLLLALVSFNATATELSAKAESLRPIKGKLISVIANEPSCPINAFCELATEVKIQFTLNSCVNDITDIHFKRVYIDGKTNLFFNVNEIVSADSKYVRCFTPKIITKKLYFLGFLEDIQLHFIGTL
jgi:hypothetical protein